MDSIYQKYGAKGSKNRTSAGTPKSAEGAAEGMVRESASYQIAQTPEYGNAIIQEWF